MDVWIDLARGPLFRIALATCVLGLLYHLFNAIYQIVNAYRRAGDRDVPFGSVAGITLRWLFPVRLLRATPVFSIASILFHSGIVLVPLFYVGHVRLWQEGMPLAWPVLGETVSDVLAILSIIGLAVLLGGRLLLASSRQLTTFQDVVLLVILVAVAASGYWAAHPTASPIAPRAMVLTHMLLGNLALVLMPTTKIVHCILYPVTQLISELGWHFPASSGRHVAVVLGKENEPV
jgi:nitrate reductase gamma subunit